MASHLHTPESVLSAPIRGEEFTVWHRHPNRTMRRHPNRYPTIFYRNKDGEYVQYRDLKGVNTPYEKA